MHRFSDVARSKLAGYLRFTPAILGVLLPLLIVFVHVAQAQTAPVTPQAGKNNIYIPVVGNAKTTNTNLPVATPTAEAPPPVVTPPPAETPINSGALFMEPNKKTGGAQIKIDAQGGMHEAYYNYVPLNKNPVGTYAYCPPPSSQCGDASKWSYLPNLGGQNKVDQIQLQLTTDGHPRILLAIDDLSKGAHLYFYGECDSNCTASTDNWRFTQAPIEYYSISYINVNSSYQRKQSFALDPQNHPAFIVADADFNPEPDHAGGYFVSCQVDCADANNWIETQFTYNVRSYSDTIYQPVLKFTPDGHPRVLALLYPRQNAQPQQPSGIYYFACDADCDSTDSWQRTKIEERTSGGTAPAWDLALDAQGRPRVVYFKYINGNGDRTLEYLWCNTDCGSDGSWQSTGTNVPTNEGIDADLELDSTGRPRVAYLTPSQLGYAWCDGDCTAAGGWQHGYTDPDDQLSADYPVALPFTCKSGIWDSYAPVLALDPQGNPRVAYDARYQANCQYQDPTDPSAPIQDGFHEIFHSVRTWFTAQP